jgi:hypothetical protein
MIKVTDEIREAARRLLLDPHDRADKDLLEAIAAGQRKRINHAWWCKFYAALDRARLAKIAAMADPARNDKEHERAVAARKLATAKARRPPGIPEPPPLPRSAAEWARERKTKTRPKWAQPTHKRRLSDSVAAPVKSDSVAPLEALNKLRAAKRAAKRAGLKCQTCGKSLAAQRATARFCNATCRSQAWRACRK